MVIGVIVWIFYSLNVSLPKLPKINIERESAPAKKSNKTPYVTRESQTASDSELLKKLEKAT